MVIVTVPFRPVPPVANPIPVPSMNWVLPPEFDSVCVWLLASDVFAMVWSSLLIEPSTSVPVRVIDPPFALVDSAMVIIPGLLIKLPTK